jgi:branched-chain amino acid transport system permease protein
MPDFEALKPYLVLGLALGGVFAMSGVGLVVLYRATGVLNLAYGAIGASGAFIAWSLIEWGTPEVVAYLCCVLFGGVVTLLYGVVFGPPFAPRDPLIKATASLGLLLILLGTMQYLYGPNPHSITLPTSDWNFELAGTRVSGTQVIGVVFPILVTVGTAIFLRVTKVGTAMRALANDREITATLGVPVRRVEAAAWLGSGLLCGAAGLLLSNLVGLEIATLTFLVIPALAAALIGRLRSLWITLAAGFVIGLVQSSLTAFTDPNLADYRNMTPFVLAIIALLWFARKRQVQVRT